MNKPFTIFSIVFVMSFYSIKTSAQCTANAGKDTTFCVTYALDTFYLGGTPLVTGGTAPYTYNWSCNYSILDMIFYTAEDYLEDITSPNPRLVNYSEDTLAFILTVTDNLGDQCIDTVVLRFCGDYVWTLDYKFVYINQGDTTQIGPSVGEGCAPLSYQWSPNYNISDPNIPNPLVWPDTTTQYSSIVIDAAGCAAGGGSFDVFVSPVGIYDQEKQFNFKIFPNPLSDISAIETDIVNAQIIFFDIFGRITQQKTLNTSSELNRRDFETGIYFYKLIQNNSILGSGKLIIL